MYTKEFLSKPDVMLETINVVESAAARDRLRSHGFDSVPVVCVGDRCVKGVDLRVVAELVGLSYDPPELLSPGELYLKWEVILRAVCTQVLQVPFDKLAYASPDRDRDLRHLAVHALERPALFIAAFDTGRRPRGTYRDITTPSMTGADIAAYGATNIAVLGRWWERSGRFDPLDRAVETTSNVYTLHELMERETWHSAQHARQIGLFLERLGIEPQDPLTDSVLAGLPMPDHVWH